MKFLFYSPIKVTHDIEEILFWSDCHFGHKCEKWPVPLWQARGFSSVEDHDEQLIERWNSVSTPNSVFFHLGDFIFGTDTIERFKRHVQSLKFKTLYMMPGNHCSGWKQVFEEQRHNLWDLRDGRRVIFIPNYVEVVANKQPIVLSHYPLVSFNGQGIGSWMLHGHCHGNLHDTEVGNLLYKAKVKDIGVECTTQPITMAQIKQEFDRKDALNFEVRKH